MIAFNRIMNRHLHRRKNCRKRKGFFTILPCSRFNPMLYFIQGKGKAVDFHRIISGTRHGKGMISRRHFECKAIAVMKKLLQLYTRHCAADQDLSRIKGKNVLVCSAMRMFQNVQMMKVLCGFIKVRKHVQPALTIRIPVLCPGCTAAIQAHKQWIRRR